jgi:Protein of unknown function DUF262
MKTGKYNIRDLFNNRYIEQIIIPEIQRDYVWGEEQVTGLLESILSDFKKYISADLDLVVSSDEELQAEFISYYRGKAFASNIGFIYAYTDHEYAGKYFLIDGQQRITTIYLLILSLMSRNHLQDDFREFYQHKDRLKLDYRVREAAQGFIANFVRSILGGCLDVADEVWFHRDYLHDQTICSVTENYKVIASVLDGKDINEVEFLEYIQEHVEFWYFDTNISEQGEELYIYMNARGEQMQSNENLKADILSNLPSAEKNRCGELWEHWQDLFWKNRQDNENADSGFNEFLKCIAGLENYLKGNRFFYSTEEFNDKNLGGEKNIRYADLKTALSFHRIQGFVTALDYLTYDKGVFAAKYEYSAWLEKCLEIIWSIFNTETTNWFADYSDQGRGVERNKMVLIWPILHYITSVDVLDIDNVFRVLRFFYLRYHNYNRSVTNINSKISEIMLDGVWGTGMEEELITEDTDSEDNPSEEQQKNNWFNRVPEGEVRLFESVIWEIEDHPHNLDGRYLYNLNSSHLFAYNSKLTLKRLIHIRDRFYELFPLKPRKKSLEILQCILIFYGTYWEIETPYYYQNLHFNNWRRVVRNADGDKKAFKLFFKDWLREPEKSLNDWLDEVAIPDSISINEMALHQQLKWYAAKLKTAMWEKGGNIALRDWVAPDKIFKKSPKFINTKGNMRGNDHNELALLLPKAAKERPI